MTSTIAANAVAAAHIQGLQAFMASEVKERATDAQLEAAAGASGARYHGGGKPRERERVPVAILRPGVLEQVHRFMRVNQPSPDHMTQGKNDQNNQIGINAKKVS